MKEINRYRLALLQYRLSLPFKQSSNIRLLLKTSLGFCFHFNVNDTVGSRVYENTLKKELPNLYLFKPQTPVGVYWFDLGDLKPRITALKKAIKHIKYYAQEN